MPEMPVAEQLEVMVPDVPMRDGEKERFGATLNLEDQRRKDEIIADLQKRLREIAGTSAGEIQSRLARSPSARKRQQAVMRKMTELRNLTRKYGDVWEGPCAPATVINLNPIDLRLYGQLQRLSIPAAGKGAKIEMGFRGRKFSGSYVTVSTPEVWLAHTGIELDPVADSPQMEARYIPPIGLAHQFYSHYCEGAPDAQHIGGILIFEGDIHALDRSHLERTQRQVMVPKASWSMDGTGEIIYTSEARLLEEYLAEELQRQRQYCESVIARGHQYATSNDSVERKNLTNIHILWHNFAVERGYLARPYEWAASPLQTGPLAEVVKCPDCSTVQDDPAQYFCRNCNAPFDAHKAFMDGKQVSPDRLAVYPEDSQEFKDILREISHRRKRLALLGLEDEPKQTRRGREPKEDKD